MEVEEEDGTVTHDSVISRRVGLHTERASVCTHNASMSKMRVRSAGMRVVRVERGCVGSENLFDVEEVV